MSATQSPLSLHRQQFEEQRRQVAELKALAEQLRADEQQLRTAIQGAFADWLVPEAAGGKPVCARALIERHGELARSLTAVEGRIAAASDVLAAAARELQRHERAAQPSAGAVALCGQPTASANSAAARDD
jgi:DNA repair exonuclease SbcCD ATPase subunit